ncbi:General alpha-glucoside permease [Colletotrichum fructicola]|nr:General alpha-glucoside permease [Colletotrichum fructicola]KAF4882120.1 General alpha-glucoside permease [Colletotrichum fructicola]KAF4899275.1 General alpha-glucoside permease [Colletotrichum fructicola]KAF4930184.1 General alpha-glucoside permease [Colletotrichum fructicola]
MAVEKVVPTARELEQFDLNDAHTVELINRAQEGDAADRKLTVRQALVKYKKAVFWALFLSTSLIMEGYDLVIITSFYGQTQFKNRFGVYDEGSGEKLIPPEWQSGLSNSALVGQLAGLVTLSTTYACEVVPTVLRPYVTAYVCMCWGAGILLSAGVVRAVASIDGDMGWRLPFLLQWVWPVPLFIGAYFAPESPWNAVRRGKFDTARESLVRLREDTTEREAEVDASLAYIRHTTALEEAETHGASFIECFKGTNLWRTEIILLENCVVWAAQILGGNALVAYGVTFLQAAGFSEIQSLNLNISLSACYVIGGIICWFLFPHVGRATLYMSGLTFLFFCNIVIGGLGFTKDAKAQIAIGVILVVSTLVNMVTVGPVCYPIVAETPSGRLRYKTIVIGRFVYNVTGIVEHTLTPRMISPIGWNWGAKAGLFYAGTNLVCNTWCYFRLPETKDRTFGELDILFENKIPARKFKYTTVDQFAGRNEIVGKEEDMA